MCVFCNLYMFFLKKDFLYLFVASFLDVTSDKLLNCRFTHPHASCTLFCFPWAGGGSNFYSAWGRNMPDNIEGTANNDLKT